MSIQRFDSEDIETFTIQTAPSTTFASSSTGLTGAVYVYPRRSESIKDLHVNWNSVSGTPTGAFAEINDIGDLLSLAKTAGTSALNANMSQYLNIVGQQPHSIRNLQKQEIIRFNTGFNLDRDMTRKFVTTNLLMPYYNKFGTNYDFAYTNYNSLNFLTASGLPTDTALLYPASSSATAIGSIIRSAYIPSGAFSFDFWINPRYTTDTSTSEFKAGTIMHMSGTYAVSLLTGSSKDSNGYANKYRLLLQLSSSADVLPSLVDPALPTGLTFLSSDNCFNKNQWHHVTVRWGTSAYNFGSGSFVVDGTERGTFYIPSASIAPRSRTSVDMPNMLTVGNYFQKNTTYSGDLFFTTLAQTRYGVPVTGSSLDSSQTVDKPPAYSLAHPLNAEVNELKIYSKYLPNSEIESRRLTGADLSTGLLFYLPPFFTSESPYRTVTASLGGTDYLGGVLAHPFENINGTTNQPFNTFLSFDTGGHLINLENYTRDFATGNYPRLFNLDATVIRNNTAKLSANGFLYATGSNKKASLAVLPCDNGYFTPNYFSLLSSLSGASFKTDNGDTAYNLVSLRNMYSIEEVYTIVSDTTASSLLNTGADGTIINALCGLNATKSIGELDQQRVPSILQQTRENGSLQVTMFDISTLFYGNKIKPTSFTITDSDLSNSGGKVGITLKDDGYGSLYRADSLGGTLAVNNSVGNIFYDNGLVLIKNPSLYFFGKNGFSCTFEGERNVHVLKMDLYANPLELVSSSNPSWSTALEASDLIGDYDKRYVYITDLYIHDDNLNIIAKSKLASPILKRTGDKLVFHVKIDF